MGSLVLLDRRADGVAVVTLNNPKVNALSQALLAELREVALELTANPAGAVVITGGERIFAAGADISEFGGADEGARITRGFHEALDAVAAIPRFVIGAVSGYALGGDCELALACDYRVGGERAVFGQPEILLGIIPGAGGTQRLARLVGVSRAKELILTGRFVAADEALRIGLATEVVSATEVLPRAMELAQVLANGPRLAMTAAKQVIDAGADLDLAAALRAEQQAFAHLFGTSDQTLGMRSFIDNDPGKAVFE